MAWALVNTTTLPSAGDDFTDGSVTLTIPATTVGNTLVVVVGMEGGQTINSISGGASFQQLERVAAGGAGWGAVEVQAGIVTSSVTSITVTVSGNSQWGEDGLFVLELSGGADPIAESGTFQTYDSGATAVSSLSLSALTPDTDETLFLVGIMAGGNISGDWSGDSDFTDVTDDNAIMHVAYRLQSGSTTAQGFSASWWPTRDSVKAILLALEGATAGGGTTEYGSAALSGSGSVATAARATKRPSAALSVSGSLAALGLATKRASITVTGTGSLVSIGGVLRSASVSFAATATATTSASKTARGAASLAGSCTSGASAHTVARSGAALAGSASLSITGTTSGSASAVLVASAALSTTPSRTRNASAALVGTGSVLGVAGRVRRGASVMLGSGTMTVSASASSMIRGQAAFSVSGTLTCQARAKRGAATLLSASVAMITYGRATRRPVTALAGSATLSIFQTPAFVPGNNNTWRVTARSVVWQVPARRTRWDVTV